MQANPEPPKKNNDKSKKISRKPLAAKNKWGADTHTGFWPPSSGLLALSCKWIQRAGAYFSCLKKILFPFSSRCLNAAWLLHLWNTCGRWCRFYKVLHSFSFVSLKLPKAENKALILLQIPW
jgi:hypothetical protein